MIKKIILMSSSFALCGFIFTGCGADETANANLKNSNLPNINVVGNGNVPNTNAPNVNLPDTDTGNANNVSTDTQNFIKTAAEDGMFEVQAGQLAQSKAQNTEVKNFGQEMVTAHTKADDQLKELAQDKNVTLPTELGADKKQKIEKLRGLSGAKFDREYMSMMIEAHEKAVGLFQSKANTGNDTAIKAFAAKNVPVLQGHLEKARNINGKLK